MLTGPASLPCVVTERLAVAPLSVMLAVAVGVVIVIAEPRLGSLIAASTVSVLSSRPSLATVTVSVPVVAPLATLIAVGASNAVKSDPLVAVPPVLAAANVMGAPV